MITVNIVDVKLFCGIGKLIVVMYPFFNIYAALLKKHK